MKTFVLPTTFTMIFSAIASVLLAQPPGSDPPLAPILEVIISNKVTQQRIGNASVTLKGIRPDATTAYTITMGPCTGGAVFHCVTTNGSLVTGSVPVYATTLVLIEAPGYVTQTHVIAIGFPINSVDAQLAPGLDVRVSLDSIAAKGGEVAVMIEVVSPQPLENDVAVRVTAVYRAEGFTGAYEQMVLSSVGFWERNRTSAGVFSTGIKARSRGPVGGRHTVDVVVSKSDEPDYILGRGTVTALKLP
ncbi:MAG: hypothetical protein LC791_09865 [Acidobacteria bacterium]|nr:hypothetical protein [Acidobacteriota bacterium]